MKFLLGVLFCCLALVTTAQAEQKDPLLNQATTNLAEGKAFLATNKKASGVKETSTGLQYQVIEQGKGKTPSATGEVTVHYEGKLLDGTVFDSSYERGQPLTLPVDGVISGWQEALTMMHEGDKWRLFIPSELAYGERGVGPIGPNQVLVFTVELISVG